MYLDLWMLVSRLSNHEADGDVPRHGARARASPRTWGSRPIRRNEHVRIPRAGLHPRPEVHLRPEGPRDERVVLRIERGAQPDVGLQPAEALAPDHGSRRAELLDEDVLVPRAREAHRP